MPLLRYGGTWSRSGVLDRLSWIKYGLPWVVIDGRFFEGRVGFVSLRRMRSFQEFLRRRYVGRVEELGMVAMTWYCVSCEYELTDRADIYLFLRMRLCSCGGNCYRFSRCRDFCQLLLQRYLHIL